MIRVATNHGEFRGRDVASIARREYGRAVTVTRYPDSIKNWGEIIRPGPGGDQFTATKIATIHSVEDEADALITSGDPLLQAVADAADAAAEAEQLLAERVEERDEAIRAAAAEEGIPRVAIARAARLSRTQTYAAINRPPGRP